MTTMTFDLPDTLFFELEQVATLQHVSIEALLVEMVRHNLKEIKVRQHFRERAARGNPERGLSLLDKIAQRSSTLPVYQGNDGLASSVAESLTHRSLLDAADD